MIQGLPSTVSQSLRLVLLLSGSFNRKKLASEFGRSCCATVLIRVARGLVKGEVSFATTSSAEPNRMNKDARVGQEQLQPPTNRFHLFNPRAHPPPLSPPLNYVPECVSAGASVYRPRPGRARHDGPRARADRSGRRAGPVLPFRHLAPAEGGRATGWAAPRDATPVSDGLISLMMPFIIDPTGGRLGFALRSLPFPLPFTCGLLVIAFHTLVARLGARHTLSHL